MQLVCAVVLFCLNNFNTVNIVQGVRLTTETTQSPSTNLTNDFYCFEFTWFGPDYNRYTKYNGTCETYLDDTRAVNIPCASPIVISYDGTPPDIDYLWAHHKQSVLCRRSQSEVCVKYSYIYNGIVNNQTHMCSKVVTSDKRALTNGCYTQTVGSYQVEICVCKSGKGADVKPCNKGFTVYLSFYFITVIVLIVQLIYVNV